MAPNQSSNTPAIKNGEKIKLSAIIPRVVLGGGNFTHQSYPDPGALPVRSIIEHAFAEGIRAFDTSPYYGPSEMLLGDAFSQPAIKSRYSRDSYILMTKVGRIAAAEFDYSPVWIRKSIYRSLERLRTEYLDVVFCHDIEYVTDEDAIGAIQVLLQLVKENKIRYIGCSSYNLARLTTLAQKVREKFGRPLDAVQIWGQLTLQNTRAEKEAIQQFRDSGVDCIFCSSPLCIGLLRAGGVPIGSLGDWHPAPPGLRRAVQQASLWVESQNQNLAALAVRFALASVIKSSSTPSRTALIIATTSVAELESNLQAIRMIAGSRSFVPNGKARTTRDYETINDRQFERDMPLFAGVRKILGQWVDYAFTSPEPEWDVHEKKMKVVQREIQVERLVSL